VLAAFLIAGLFLSAITAQIGVILWTETRRYRRDGHPARFRLGCHRVLALAIASALDHHVDGRWRRCSAQIAADLRSTSRPL